jgi:hypothetical protein
VLKAAWRRQLIDQNPLDHSEWKIPTRNIAVDISTVPAYEDVIHNISDDEPAPVSVWLPELALILGAKPPRRVPVWLGRLVAGEPGVSLFTRIRGASNAKAKQALGWDLIYPSWRDGFRHGLAG